MWAITCTVSLVKILFLPSYRSTDFEVHRNWLAITHSLPLSEWYTEETSEWTLDYPPLFAWFEWLLSQIAYYFDPKMLEVSNLNYASEMTILFQRLSVILTDLVFAYGLMECIREIKKVTDERRSDYNTVFLITFANAGLIIVDTIHFQYNGFLFGVMFLSIARILQGRELEGAFWFTVLLNLKHIYLYIAPAYFVYLLRSYCLASKPGKSVDLKALCKKLFSLGFVVIFVFALSFGPFIASDQLFQVVTRLFPFKRGLCHAFWAPNFWALYNFADKVLAVIGTLVGFDLQSQTGSMTCGLVQEFSHTVLPSIAPWFTFVLTAVFMLPCLYTLWVRPYSLSQFLRVVTMCGFCSYMIGWHVHEKAILMVILPLSLLCLFEEKEAKYYLILNIVGNFSLFPLIFTREETVIKVCLLLLHALVVCSFINKYWDDSSKPNCLNFIPLLNCFETLYLIGLVPLFFYEQFGHQLFGLNDSLPFFPLMMISVYCSLGVLYCYVGLYLSLTGFLSSVKLTIRSYSFKGQLYTVEGEFAEKQPTVCEEEQTSTVSDKEESAAKS